METLVRQLCLTALLAPLTGALIAGFFGKIIGKRASHTITIIGIAIAFICSTWLFGAFIFKGVDIINTNFYVWGNTGNLTLNVGVLIDRLTLIMIGPLSRLYHCSCTSTVLVIWQQILVISDFSLICRCLPSVCCVWLQQIVFYCYFLGGKRLALSLTC